MPRSNPSAAPETSVVPQSGTFKLASRASFLVLDEDAATTRTLARVLAAYGDVVLVHTADEAIAAVPIGEAWTAVLLGVSRPDGSGFAVLEALRRLDTHLPALMMTALREAAVTNRIYAARASVLRKPFEGDLLRDFVESPVVQARTSSGSSSNDDLAAAEAIERLLVVWGGRYRLTDAEVAVLRGFLHGRERGEIAAERGTSEETIKKQIGSLLRKTGHQTERMLVWRAMHELRFGS